MGRTSFSFLFLLLLLFCLFFPYIWYILYQLMFCALLSSFPSFLLLAVAPKSFANSCESLISSKQLQPSTTKFSKELIVNNIELIDLNINAVWKKSLTSFLSIVSTGCVQGESYFKKRTFPTLKSQTKIRPSGIVAIPHGHVNLVTVFPIK